MTKKREKKSGWQQKLLDQDQSSPTSAAFSRRKYPAEFKTASALRAESSPDGAYHHRRHPALTESRSGYSQSWGTRWLLQNDRLQTTRARCSLHDIGGFPCPSPPCTPGCRAACPRIFSQGVSAELFSAVGLVGHQPTSPSDSTCTSPQPIPTLACSDTTAPTVRRWRGIYRCSATDTHLGNYRRPRKRG